MKKRTEFTIFIFCSSLIAFCCLFFIYLWKGIYLPKNLFDTEARPFLIKKGESLFQIAGNLEEKGLIENKFLFGLHVFLKGNQADLQAGEYLLNPSMNIIEITRIIISGEIVRETITIPEGWNLRDIAWYFENRGMFQAEELFELAGLPAFDTSLNSDFPNPRDFSEEYDFLNDKPDNLGLEGYLFPDTYQVNGGDKLLEIVRKMLDNFDKKLTPDLRKEIKKQEKRIFEIVNMASLLEREVKTVEDKRLVSGILWKRLENEMPLQVDASIAYITGKRTTEISIEETKIDSPYNTYKYKGLPLGPICNPGLESIQAALSPKNSDYWFYLSTLEGETIFSRNLKEHNAAKATYLK